MAVDQRIGENLARYGPDHLVSRATARSTLHLTATVGRVTCLLRDSQQRRRSSACQEPANVRGLGQVPGPDIRLMSCRNF
jgi:hypothetical protein